MNGNLIKQYTSGRYVQSNPYFKFGISEFDDEFGDPRWKGSLQALLMYDRSLSIKEITSLNTLYSSGNI